LTGLRVVITRPEGQSEALCEQLRALGAFPIAFPVIAITPPEPGGDLDRAITGIANYDWIIFTSVNGVEHFWARLTAMREQPGTDVNGIPGFRGSAAAIGPRTAAALRQRGASVHLMPDEYRSEAILDAIGAVQGQRILLPRADIARRELANGLRALGARVDEVTAYRTVPAKPQAAAFEELRQGVDIITFTSSSTVRGFVALTAGISYGDPLVVCIGPVTADTALGLGLHVDAVAEEYTTDGLIEALARLPGERRVDG
jgi:uroporphyrinogen-III synthase